MKKILLLIAMFAGFTAAKADNKIYFEKTSYDVVKGGSVIIPVCFQCDNVAGGVKAIQCNWALTPETGASGLTNNVDALAKADGRYTGTVVAAFAGSVLGYAFGSANPLIGDDGPLWLVKFDAADDAEGSYTFSLSDAWVNIGGTQIDCVPANAQVTINIVDYVTIDENEAFTPFEITKDVHLIRSFEAGKYYTICLPFAVNATALTAAFGTKPTLYKFNGVSLDSDELNKITLDFASSALIAANTPYIMLSNVTIDNPVFAGAKVKAVTNNITTSATEEEYVGADVYFKGTYTPGTVVPAGALYLKSDDAKLYVSQGGTKMKGTRAYIDITELGATFDVKNCVLALDGQETAIDAIDADLKAEGWFDLNGRKLAEKPATKGVYISNGKKVVVK